ncbi:slipin family protein [Mangrovibacter yixingensis]|uniref:slipin family protein n=1 Tax=Mangrovibacter yixingensis TaxID=1529639 RepID=UPI001CF99D51|nr:slipin family protein [Mangrovibacter yixingensis]
MAKKITIRKGQIGLLAQHEEIEKILEAGQHHLPWFSAAEVQLIKLDGSIVDDELSGYLRHYKPEWVARYCLEADTSQEEVGVLYCDGVLQALIPPSTRRLYWQNQGALRLERVAVQDVKLPEALQNLLVKSRTGSAAVKGRDIVVSVQVPAWHTGVLKIDGVTQELLPPGVHAYWKVNHLVEAEVVDLRLQALEVSGQEILTKDKVSIRLNMAVNWRYQDVLSAFAQLTKPLEYLYREVQFALRQAVGTRSLDELLEDKLVLDGIVGEQVTQRLAPFGIEIASVGVKDIILPGDMKAILTRLVEAEKSAQANVIRRREETAATRSLLNTAKVMENNPVALRLKEMETLEKVAERIDKISVFGGLDQVLQGLVKINV